ncbi:hypothetical protein DFP73DRAFT_595537 [Morchella snyderi]|nr:hypothetical protein DFP73DRAFT_595537 [Morchella snyderi]
MFTATPPSVNRRRSAGRKSLGIGEKEQLPFVATRNNYSYGSQFSNMPKPPQLAETKVPLSVALKQQQDASQARMRAEEIERERAAREPGTVEPEDRRRFDPDKTVVDKRLQKETETARAQQETRSLRNGHSSAASDERTAPTAVSTSMPPPPRRRSPRQQSEVSDHSYSIGFDTTQGMSRSYASEDDVGLALGRKFTQNLADLPSDGSATDEDDEPTDEHWLGTPARGSTRQSDAGSAAGSKHSGKFSQEPASRHKTPSEHGLPEEVDQEYYDDYSQHDPSDMYGSGNESETDKEEEEDEEEEEEDDDDERYARNEYMNERMSKQLELAEQLLPILVEGVVAAGPPLGKPDHYGLDLFYYHWNWWLYDRTMAIIATVASLSVLLWLYLWVVQSFFGIDFRNLRGTHFTYERPLEPPTNWEDVQVRMYEIEKVIQDFGYHASREQLEFQDTMRKEVEVLEGKVISLEEGGQESGKAVADARKRLEELDDSIKAFAGFRKKIESDFESQKRMLRSLRNQQDSSMGSIKDSLPDKIVLDVNNDGTYTFPPDFERALQKLIKQTYPSDGPTGFAETDRETLQRDPDWNDFLQKNDKRLRGLIDEHTGLTYDQYKDQVLLSKGTVTQLIDQKVKQNGDWAVNVFWPKIEKEFLERLNQDSVLPTLVEDAIKKSPLVVDSAVQKYFNQNPHLAPKEGHASSGSGFSSDAEVPSLSVPDYASLLTGGKISPWATSPTFEWSSNKNRWFYAVFGKRRGVIAQPTVAITPTSDVGQCWPFPGDQGNIGVRLALPIFATQISVEHIPKSHAVDISSAPRKIEFWAQFDDAETRERAEKAAARALNEIEWSKDRLWDRDSTSSPPGPSGALYDKFVKLGVFKYDINSGNPRIQTWDLPVDLVNLNITTQLVVFKVINNWGHPDYTCLYRVRVHGKPQMISKVMDEQDLDAGKRAIPIHPYQY